MAIEQNQDYVHTGDIEFQAGVKITTAPTNGYVLTTDGSGNASWQASGSGAIQSATITITSAQLLTIHTTPIQLVPAQGANTIIIPIRITSHLVFNTAAYAGDTLLKAILDPIFLVANFGVISTLAAASDSIISLTAPTLSQSGSISTLFNTPLVATTTASNPTTGDSDVDITVLYSVINL